MKFHKKSPVFIAPLLLVLVTALALVGLINLAAAAPIGEAGRAASPAAAQATNQCSLTVNVTGAGVVNEMRGSVDPALRAEIGPDNSYLILESSQLFVKYLPYIEDSKEQFSIKEFRIKSAGNIDQAGNYLGADASRGALTNAQLIYDGADRKTVRLTWSPGLIEEVTIYANARFLEINYVDIRLGTLIVDLGRPGGVSNGQHIAYGGDAWIRGYITFQEQVDTVKGSYYNRYPADGVNDPADGGSLNYNDHFILGVFNPGNNVGFGRVMPVADTSIIKLLLSPSERRGFELYPHPFFQAHAPFTGYLFGVTGGGEDVIAYGKQLADGKIPYECGDTVELTAVPDEGWYFAGWSGDLTGSANPQSITLTTDHVVNATFSSEEFTLDVALTPADGRGGVVAKDPDKPTYQFNEEVTLTAQPAPGWTFAGWGGALSGTELTEVVTMTQDTAVSAAFTQDQYALNVSVVGQGEVRINPLKSSYVYGDQVTLTPLPSAGWEFSGWSGAVSGSADPLVLTITGNTSLTATFSEAQYALEVVISGPGNVTITPNRPFYNYDDVVILTAIPDSGKYFGGWGGDVVSSDNPLQLTIRRDTRITALFTDNAPPVIQPVPDAMVYEGARITFVVRASDADGDPITLTATNLPPGASFVDNGNGTAVFAWTPPRGSANVYTITFVASDGTAVSTESVTITVLRANYVFLPIVMKGR